MTTWLRRARQTRTPVHDQQGQAAEQRSGRALSYRMLVSMQLLLQLLLWLLLWGYDMAEQTAWQAALMLALPLCGLWALWSAGSGRTSGRGDGAHSGVAASRGGAWTALALLPCLMLDIYLLMNASYSLMRDMIPSFSDWMRIATVVAFPLVTTLSGRENGVAYGAYAMRTVLAALLLLSTVLVFTDASPARLWPLMGEGLGNTAMAALNGAGATWGVALLFLLPSREKKEGLAREAGRRSKPRSSMAAFVLLPLLMCVLWALWLGMTRPWSSESTPLLGGKLMGLARFSKSIMICEACSLFWMLSLPFGLCGTAMGGEKLLRQAMPKLPGWLCATLLLLPGAVGLCLAPGQVQRIIFIASPYRAALSAAVAVALLVLGRKGKKA